MPYHYLGKKTYANIVRLVKDLQGIEERVANIRSHLNQQYRLKKLPLVPISLSTGSATTRVAKKTRRKHKSSVVAADTKAKSATRVSSNRTKNSKKTASSAVDIQSSEVNVANLLREIASSEYIQQSANEGNTNLEPEQLLQTFDQAVNTLANPEATYQRFANVVNQGRSNTTKKRAYTQRKVKKNKTLNYHQCPLCTASEKSLVMEPNPTLIDSIEDGESESGSIHSLESKKKENEGDYDSADDQNITE